MKIWYFDPNNLRAGIRFKKIEEPAMDSCVYSLDRNQIALIYKSRLSSLEEEIYDKISQHEDDIERLRKELENIENMGDEDESD